MFRITQLLVLVLFQLINLAFSQEGVTYKGGTLILKVKNEISNIVTENGNAKINENWFDDISTQYSISELKPVFQNDFEDMELFYYVEFPTSNTVDAVKSAFENETQVESALNVVIGESYSTPNDALYANQWNLTKIEAPDAWDEESGSSSVIVAILDTGIDFGNGSPSDIHPDLSANIWNGNGMYGKNYYSPVDFPLDDGGHGTHVAGIVGAITNNSIGVAGLAGGGFSGDTGVKIMVAKVQAPGSFAPYSLWVAQAIEWATDNGADIINMSFGFGSGSSTGCPETWTEPFQEIKIACDYAYSNGVILVAAAGNDSNDRTVTSCNDFGKAPRPAFYSNVIAVANTNNTDLKYTTSTYADYIDVSAPGAVIKSTDIRTSNPTGYNSRTGTSMSSPLVAGLAALIKSYAPNADNDMVRDILKETSDDIDALNPSYAGKLGSGRINANLAITLLKDVPAKPTSINLQNVSNKPYITWAANTEADLVKYKVHITYEERNGLNPRFWSYSYATLYTTETNYTDNSFYIGVGNTYAYYKVAAVDILDKTSLYSTSVSTTGGLFKEGQINDDHNNIPITTALNANYPNPFNPSTNIPFDIASDSQVNLSIYDSRGSLVNTLVNQTLSAGTYNITWASLNSLGHKMSSGVYYYKLEIRSLNSQENYINTKKMVLLK